MVLAERMSVKFLWVLAHKGIGGNEISDQVAKRASAPVYRT
jgi:ribonuclease HI